ncbi:ATM_1a_G0053790.mRNA.1.CDS.1 [Saccharomyces cerevisiae]|nr:ATM_1a_G0053790.mRNA.1.CDS.1 [Saccharomyces cerevisiae]CAI7372043.1 ATM_1a_G0053790.mRNA.1.CDS.1 [Saccharomyces cerevisiae]
MPVIGAEVPYKTLFRACDTSFWYSRRLNLVANRSSFVAYCCLSPVYQTIKLKKNNTVPLFPGIVQNSRYVLGVVYC